jgi:alkylation response protein AidB-like acyl-CoA dehydrogenase
MLNFDLTAEQKEMRKLAHDFAEKEIRPVAMAYDETEEFPWDVVQKAHELGLTTFQYPEEYGGGGIVDPITNLLIAEELAWGCAGIQTSITGSGLAGTAIMVAGTEEQKKKYIGQLCDPNTLRLAAMGLTEPGAGSDVSSMATSAVKEGDQWVLNGTKQFITHGGIADVHVIFAQTDKSKGWAGIEAFVIDKGTPGLSQGRKESKMGVRASYTAQVILEDCRIPLENRLSGLDGKYEGVSGGMACLKMLESTRPAVGAAALGVARAAYEFSLQYAQDRKAFGKPIIANQGISFKLADMATQIDASRLLIWRAGWLQSLGKSAVLEASMSKLFAADAAMQTTIDAIQILGGYGYTREYPVEKWARDAKIFQIWEGTSEIQRLVISRAISGQYKK